MFCRKCGKEIDTNAIHCIFCGEPTDNAETRIIENENSFYEVKALVSWYSSLVSLGLFILNTFLIILSFAYAKFDSEASMISLDNNFLIPAVLIALITESIAVYGLVSAVKKRNNKECELVVYSLSILTVVVSTLMLFVAFSLLIW